MERELGKVEQDAKGHCKSELFVKDGEKGGWVEES